MNRSSGWVHPIMVEQEVWERLWNFVDEVAQTEGPLAEKARALTPRFYQKKKREERGLTPVR